MNGHTIILCLALSLAACGSEDKPEPSSPTDAVQSLYLEAAQRALTGFTSGPFVISRDADGNPEHQGEGLLWGSVLLASLPCDMGAPLSAALTDMLISRSGEAVRFLPLGEYAGGREMNFDEETGLYGGIAGRVKNCPGEEDALKTAWIARENYITEHGGKLHANVDESMPDEFTFTRDAISHRFGLRTAPHTDRLRILETQIAAWALGVKIARAPAYRVHLGLRHFLAIEALGYQISERGRGAYCTNTDGMDIPLVDWWCGRGVTWLDQFEYNQFEYRHQRAGAWEAPDGNGLATPAVDLLDYLHHAFRL